MSIAQAEIAEAAKENLFGAWSEMLVGDRPVGLIDCYLVEANGVIQIAAIWDSEKHHEQAFLGDDDHPGQRVFAACGVAPTHSVYRVIGRIH